jgi:hypothetical protein
MLRVRPIRLPQLGHKRFELRLSGRLFLWQSGNAKKTKFPFPSPTSCCSDVPVFATSESMNFIVSATTESLSSTWRAPRYRGRLLHALTRG